MEGTLFSYPITLAPDDGTVLVTCPDLPEVTTFGETEDEARRMAQGAIAEALAARLDAFADIPRPSGHGPAVRVPLQMQAKVALLWALRDAGLTRAELARRLDWHRPQVDRLFAPNHATRFDQLDAAFEALGCAPAFEVSASV